jgi:hypothetical protein
VAVVQYTFTHKQHPVAAVQYTFTHKQHPVAVVQYIFTRKQHPVAVVQYTFTHKQYTEQHNQRGVNKNGTGYVAVLRTFLCTKATDK